MIKRDKVLVIVAHQDDEVIGCGGTISRLFVEGSKIKVIFVTDGQTGIDQRDLYDQSSIVTVRMAEAHQAAKVIGVDSVDTFHVGCQNVNVGDQMLFHSIIASIRDFKPNIVLTHSDKDKHRDHRAVNSLVTEACWKANENIHSELGKQHAVDDVWSIEILDMHDDPDFIFRLDESHIKSKLDAMDIYCSQEKVVEGIKNSIEGLAKVRGYMAGCKYGEAFKRISKVPVIV